eukprot:Clim_evm33s195 gene=Clim_evmTU33s195
MVSPRSKALLKVTGLMSAGIVGVYYVVWAVNPDPEGMRDRLARKKDEMQLESFDAAEHNRLTKTKNEQIFEIMKESQKSDRPVWMIYDPKDPRSSNWRAREVK